MSNEDTIELSIGQIWKSYAGRKPEYMNKEIRISNIVYGKIGYVYLHDNSVNCCNEESFDHYFEYVRG